MIFCAGRHRLPRLSTSACFFIPGTYIRPVYEYIRPFQPAPPIDCTALNTNTPEKPGVSTALRGKVRGERQPSHVPQKSPHSTTLLATRAPPQRPPQIAAAAAAALAGEGPELNNRVDLRRTREHRQRRHQRSAKDPVIIPEERLQKILRPPTCTSWCPFRTLCQLH